jgi:hypothetical protein
MTRKRTERNAEAMSTHDARRGEPAAADVPAAAETGLGHFPIVGIGASAGGRAAFEALDERVILTILAGRPADAPIRIGGPGCSTGEEDLHAAQRAGQGRFLPPMTVPDATLPLAGLKTAVPRKLPLREMTEQALLQQLVQVGALVTDQGDILYLHGRTGRSRPLSSAAKTGIWSWPSSTTSRGTRGADRHSGKSSPCG